MVNIGSAHVTGASVRGGIHRRAKQPCQDCFRTLITASAVILSAADGHGSPNCPHSKAGASAAVSVFCKTASALCKKYKESPERLAEALALQLPKQIDREWKLRVERIHRNKKRESLSDNATWELYGTTLLGLAVTPDFAFAYQLGDGGILCFTQQRTEHAVRGHKFLGGGTHSLCQPESWRNAVTNTIRFSTDTENCAFMLCTDGFENSYINEAEFLQACTDYHKAIAKHGFAAVSANLKHWLAETTDLGCGDDVTVILAEF